MTGFMNVDAQAISGLAADIDKNGFAVIENFFSPEQLQAFRDYVAQETGKRGHEYFALYGPEALSKGPFADVFSSQPFNQLLAQVYEHGASRKAPPDEAIFPVLRCLQGTSARREYNFFHYDATLLTALSPVFIPTEGEFCGDLVLFKNIRKLRSSVVLNLIEKALFQNRFSQWLVTTAIEKGLLRPTTLKLVPGNLYLFWGYRSLHANQRCDPSMLRSTVLYHFGNPHRNNFMARLFLGSNERRARQAKALALRNAIEQALPTVDKRIS